EATEIEPVDKMLESDLEKVGKKPEPSMDYQELAEMDDCGRTELDPEEEIVT
ncbi:18206_t:CDS:2, partial [Gigaspora rosea]